MVNDINNVTKVGEFSRDFDLKSQIRRAAISITSNIAEGFGRRSRKEFINFLNYSHGSCLEVQSQVYQAIDWAYISNETFEDLYSKTDEVSKMVLGLENYLRKLQN